MNDYQNALTEEILLHSEGILRGDKNSRTYKRHVKAVKKLAKYYWRSKGQQPAKEKLFNQS